MRNYVPTEFELAVLDEFPDATLADRAESGDPKAAEVLRQRKAGLRRQTQPGPSKVRVDPLAVRRRVGPAIQQWHNDWVAGQVAKGVDGPCPEGEPDGSDYNQHFADMEASAEDLDEFWAGVNAISAGAAYPPVR